MKSLQNTGLIILLLVMMPFSLLQANEAEIKALKSAIAVKIPQATGATIKATPLAGIYEVMSAGQIMYMDKNARYIIDGDMFDMQTRQNLTEETRGGIRLTALNDLGEKNMLVYTPKGDVKHTITVFTDIYCPYCRKLHDEMDQYMNNGIKVRYIFVPFKGKRSVDTSVSVWCAKDRNKAMDKAKSGEEVEAKKCDNPIAQHQNLAQQIGIRGTPAIMMTSGQLMPGYVPAAKLIEQLNAAQ